MTGEEVSHSSEWVEDFGTEGDRRRTRRLEDALGRFFGPRRPTFQRAFQGSSVAYTLLTLEMFAFHTSLLCAGIEKSVLPLLDVNEPKMAAALRAMMETVIDCGKMRTTHHDARELLRAAMIACLEDMAAEHKRAVSASAEGCISHREPSESSDVTPSSSLGTANAPEVDRRSAPEQLGRGFGGSL
jgi:hypothetical protein